MRKRKHKIRCDGCGQVMTDLYKVKDGRLCKDCLIQHNFNKKYERGTK